MLSRPIGISGSLLRSGHNQIVPCIPVVNKALKNALSSPARRFISSATTESFSVDNPYTLKTILQMPYVGEAQARTATTLASSVQKSWANTSLDERIALCNRFLVEFEKRKDKVAADITAAVGKPLSQSFNEINGMADRTKGMIDLAPAALADDVLPAKGNIIRKITKEPVGVVLCIAPWNYPLLTAINCVVPAVLAGNAVIIKHATRTALCGDHIADAFAAAGAPPGLVQSIHMSHDTTSLLLRSPLIQFVSFTGSVRGGREVYSQIGANRFIDCTLELGGNDPAYVAEDADVVKAAASLVDGAMYNAGQSCCGIERVYVHWSIYKDFVHEASKVVNEYVLGDPTESATSMGPIALPNTPEHLSRLVKDAVAKGATISAGSGRTVTDKNDLGRFFSPTLVSQVTHSMAIMREESFGPLMSVMGVNSDDEAVSLMNDSDYGLTAAIYTNNQSRTDTMARRLQAGTVFMNRCDYLDPYLSWTGQKDTGKGCSLSLHGFRGVTRLKSLNFRTSL